MGYSAHAVTIHWLFFPLMWMPLITLWSYHFTVLTPVDLIEIVNLLNCSACLSGLHLLAKHCCHQSDGKGLLCLGTVILSNHKEPWLCLFSSFLCLHCSWEPGTKAWTVSFRKKTAPVCRVSPLSRPLTIRGQFCCGPKLIAGYETFSNTDKPRSTQLVTASGLWSSSREVRPPSRVHSPHLLNS